MGVTSEIGIDLRMQFSKPIFVVTLGLISGQIEYGHVSCLDKISFYYRDMSHTKMDFGKSLLWIKSDIA